MALRKAPYKRVPLTVQQQRQWSDTLSALSWIAPGFTHIIYTLLHNSGEDDVALFTRGIGSTAATDGFQLIFHPDKFFAYTLMERVFIVLHEVMHEILNHVRAGYGFRVRGNINIGTKELPYDHDFANIIQDYIINAILIASNMGKFNPDWLYSDKIATDTDQWVVTYFKWYTRRNAIMKGLQCRDGKGEGESSGPPDAASPHQFDAHIDPHESKGDDPADVPERNEAQWEIVVKQAMDIQQAQGKLPASLKQFFDELLRPKVNWADHIRGLMIRMAGSGAYDWRKLDRRLITRSIGSPGMSGYGAGLIMVGGDSSGSVFQDPTLVARFLGEIGGIVEDLQPEETRVIWCDMEIQRVDVCTDPGDVRKMIYDGVPGGGGTDFRPVFDYIEKEDLRPDVLVYLTDGFGTFPKLEPEFQVIWGDISHGQAKYPWGTVVDIPTSNSDA